MQPLALYIHIPFCSSKCHYCAFSVVTQQDQQEAYVNELLRELAARLSAHQRLDTVYIGGGTPSLLAQPLLTRLLGALKDRLPKEVTMECNPEQVTEEFLHFLKSEGVTRVSLGIQTLQQSTLQAMNRQHTAQQALSAMAALQSSGLSWNADTILGLPGVTEDQFLTDLDTILRFEPQHLSCYFLSVEPGTVLSRNYTTSDDDVETYHKVCTRLKKAGFTHTEISNWARPGHACQHNLHYWHGDEYLGVGLSASSHRAGQLLTNTRNLQVYLQGQWQSEEPVPLTRTLHLLLTSSTRLAEGLSWQKIAQHSTSSEVKKLQDTTRRLRHMGLLQASDTSIILTEQAYPLHEAVLREIMNSLESL